MVGSEQELRTEDLGTYVADTEGTHSSGQLQQREDVGQLQHDTPASRYAPSNAILDDLLEMERTRDSKGSRKSKERQGGMRIVHVCGWEAYERCRHDWWCRTTR